MIYDLYQAPKGYIAESVRILNQDGESSESDDTDNFYQRRDSGIGLRGRECRSGGRGGNRLGGSVGRVHEQLKGNDQFWSCDCIVKETLWNQSEKVDHL